MKKTALLILLIGIVAYTQAQNNESIQTLLKKPEKVRAYIGPIFNTATLDGEMAYLGGFNAALIFNDQFVLGLYELEQRNNILANNTNYAGYKIDFKSKGIMLGYIFMPKSILHFNVNANIGKGELEIYDDPNDQWLKDDFVFLVSPSVEAELNVTKFLRVGIGANYRFAFDVNELNNYDNNDFSGVGAFISLKFGWFR